MTSKLICHSCVMHLEYDEWTHLDYDNEPVIADALMEHIKRGINQYTSWTKQSKQWKDIFDCDLCGETEGGNAYVYKVS